MTIDHFNYNTKCRTNSASKKMEKGEEKEDLRTVECLRGRLLAERQVSRSVKDETDLITRKMEELEKHLKEEIRLREKAEKRLKFLMKKLEFIKESQSFEGYEQLSSSEVSCLSSVSKEEKKETYENGLVEEEKADQTTENVASMEEEEESNSKLKDVSSGEESVVASTSSHEAESQASNDFS
ncbi:Transmembrane protein [Hirschfeldia incana]|nr:Transmembrane protein [Hirschfeldia incana]